MERCQTTSGRKDDLAGKVEVKEARKSDLTEMESGGGGTNKSRWKPGDVGRDGKLTERNKKE